MKKYGDYWVTIGLEIHVGLKTKQKLFSSTENSFHVENLSYLEAGVPGILPVLSKEPVEMAIAFGLAVNAQIKKESIFERKHYFYPDLPMGYQITQQHEPIIVGGQVKLSDNSLVQIEHAHLECDAAKSIHDLYSQYTAIDLSRCSSPLLEIVSTPCIHSPEDAKAYAKSVHSLVTFMGICDGRLEEGSFRVDASISLSKTEKLGTRVEIKNISSFSFLETALNYEISRQMDLLDSDKSVIMETRLFNEKDLTTHSMRTKETVAEYRYMPDPDITPLVFDDNLIDETIKKYDINFYQYKEQIKVLLSEVKEDELITHLSGRLKNQWLEVIADKSLQKERIIKLLAYWYPDVIIKMDNYKRLSKEDLLLLEKSGLQAKECKHALELWLSSEKDLKDCLPNFMSADELKLIVENVLNEYKSQILKYKSGEQKMLQFLIGKVMSQVKGKAPANEVKIEVERYLKAT